MDAANQATETNGENGDVAGMIFSRRMENDHSNEPSSKKLAMNPGMSALVVDQPTRTSSWIATHAQSPTKLSLHRDVSLRNVEWL
jgi:hypothetical protein